jgi:hypothetical protein
MPFNIFLNLIDRADRLSSIKRTISVLVILSAITFISWGFNTHTFDRFYNAVQPHNQTYTELAFNNVNKLPSTIPNNNQVKFSFMIHNVEGKTVSYPFVITLEKGNTYKVLKIGTVTLTPNNAVSIPENLSIQETSQRQEVEITLTSLKQSIDFWLTGSKS